MTSAITVNNRRRNLRVVFFLIILATLPFYCAGIVLLGTTPRRPITPTPNTQTVRPTVTRVTNTPIVFPTSNLPTNNPLLPTPPQFVTAIPPIVIVTFPVATIPVFPTQIIFTPAPSLTPIPSLTPFPTAEPITNTPIPFDTATPFPDSDGDGVPDNLDPCPLVPFPGTGCPPTDTPTEFIIPSETPLPP
jgi:hypothetical protein